jgi:hypothetical protein
MNFGGFSKKVNLGSTSESSKRKLQIRRNGLQRTLYDNTTREQALYGSILTVYDEPPDATLSLAEFEKYALTRLKGTKIAG